MQRAAGERREPGAEDGARIDQVRIGHDLRVQCGLGLVEQRAYQAIREPGRNGARASLRGFARTPVVEAALRLAAQMPRGDELRQLFRGLRALAEHLADGETDVEAN